MKTVSPSLLAGLVRRPWLCSSRRALAFPMTTATRSTMAAAATRAPKRRQRRSYVLHDVPQVGLALETDARRVGQGDAAVDNRAVVGETAERREHLRVGFVAATLHADGDVERKLMA